MEIVVNLDLRHTRRFLLEHCIMLHRITALNDDDEWWAGDGESSPQSESGEAAGGGGGGGGSEVSGGGGGVLNRGGDGVGAVGGSGGGGGGGSGRGFHSSTCQLNLSRFLYLSPHLVCLSAQPEPFWSLAPFNPPNVSRKSAYVELKK
jgi:hypothetical protein